jgi:hypothetical protein
MTEDKIPDLLRMRSLEEHEQLAMETLRDRFAMAALTGILANARHLEAISLSGQTSVKSQTQLAYRFADAMLEERRKKP